MADEAKRTNPRDMILKSIEESLPKGVSSDAGEVLKQAVELHALVIIVDIRTEADLEPLRSKPVMEELLTNQVLFLAPTELMARNETFPQLETLTVYEGHTWGCFMNDARLANAHVKLILSKIRPVPGGIPSHYERVSVLHLSSVQISKESQADLAAVLKMDKCPIRVLDLSNTQLDVPALVKSLETNSTLRSLDVRKVSTMVESLERIGAMLLKEDSVSCLAYMRCDAFDVVEGEKLLLLRERPMLHGAMLLLTGLFRHNRDVLEVDLAATSLKKEWVITLIETLAKARSTVSALNLAFNSALSEADQKDLLGLLQRRGMKIALNF